MTDYAAPTGVTPARPSSGLLTVVGLASIASAIGAGTGGFLGRFSADSFIDFTWANTLRDAAIFALIGGVLALCQQEIALPIVIGSCAPIVAVVGTTVAELHLKLSRLLDPYPVRGVLLLGAAITAAFGMVLGLTGLRGHANAGFGVPAALLTLVSLGSTAALFHLDKFRHAMQLRPFSGFIFIALVSVVCSFAGRYGVFASSIAAATIVSLFIDSIEFGGFRRPAAIADVIALTLVIALGTTTVAMTAKRESAVGVERPSWEAQWDIDPSPYASTTQVPVQRSAVATSAFPAPGGTITGQTSYTSATPRPAHGGPPTPPPVASLPTNEFATTADQLLSGHPLIAPYEATSAIVQQPVRDVDTGAVSTVGQWAADPYGRHQFRYWDGGQWTEHVQDDGDAAIDHV